MAATIMVTGVGAIIGYGLLRSLSQARPELRLVGTDTSPDAVGRAWCSHFVTAPRSDDPTYGNWLTEVVDEQHVALLIPGIEQDAFGLFDLAPANRPSCAIALNSAPTISVSRDKAVLHAALAGCGDDAAIETTLSGSYDELVARFGLPFLLKKRCSYGSKGQVRILGRAEFDRHAAQLGDTMLAQAIVGDDDEEYTVGLFGDGCGAVCASIALRRRLAADGSTQRAWVAEPPGLAGTVERLAGRFRPLGPTNFQFRRHHGVWKLLEINPRVSSSTSIRAAFGFNDGAMCVDYYLGGRLPRQPTIQAGFANRFIEDQITFG